MTRAITVEPGVPGSARLDVLDAPPGDGDVLVEGLALGVCGTDREITEGAYGFAPAGRDRVVLGHESLGRVLEAPPGSGLDAGDLIAGIVRRPDPEPCACCARDEWDLCRNGRYTERGIKELDGFGAERWRIEPEYAVRLDDALERVGVLTEPTTILVKAWERIDRLAELGCAPPARAAITGAGPIGLLAAMLARARGLDTWVTDIVEDGIKPDLVRALGAQYHRGSVCDIDAPEPDVVIECTGVAPVVFEAMRAARADGVVCLTGVSPAGRTIEVDAGALNNELVLENTIVFGSVNANRRHYEAAAQALLAADADWLERLITRRVGLDDWADALARRPDDVKVVVELR